MKATSLQAFVRRVSAAKRLNFADLRRLQRDVLPDGPRCRGDVEALIALDAALDRADAGWATYIVGAVRDFLAGADKDTGETGWLAAALSAATPKTAMMIAKAVAPVVEDDDGALRALAKGGPKRTAKAAACATGLSSRKISAPVAAPPRDPGLSFTWPAIRLGRPALTVTLHAPAEDDRSR